MQVSRSFGYTFGVGCRPALLHLVTKLDSQLNTDINNDIFPLHYSGPYPITRGIKVETGAIIIVCAMGIMSQMKIWKIIRRRMEEKAREQEQRDEEGNVADEAHGRRVEDGIKRERGSWEAAYGNVERCKPQHLDSGIGTDDPSTRKGSLSMIGTSDVQDLDSEAIELQEVGASPERPKKGDRFIIHIVQDDDISPIPSISGEHLAYSTRGSGEPSINESQTGTLNHFSSAASFGGAAAVGSVDPNLTLKPNITHLPFKIPDPNSRSEDGRSSVAASAASESLADRWSKRLSGSSIIRKLSKRSQPSFIAASTSEEALMIPDTEDDRASSIAATVDGVSEKDDSEEEMLSVRDERPSFEILRKQDSMQALMQRTHPGAESSPGQSTNQVALGDSQVKEFRHVRGSIDPRPESVALPDSEIGSITDARSTVEELKMELRASVVAASEASGRLLGVEGLGTNLPEGASRVVTAYRTNEWAKHLDGADLPEIDEPKVERIRAPDSSQPDERAAPVNVGALQQTPLNAEPAPILTVKTHSLGDRPASYFRSKNPFHRQQDMQQLKPAVHHLTREKAMERMPSQTSLANSMERSPSQTSLSSTRSRKEQYRPPLPKFRSSHSSVPSARGFRSSSNPIIASPLVESPIEEGVEASFPTRCTPSSTHLMFQRNSMLRNKPSSTSLLRPHSSNVTLDQHPAFRGLNEDENIPLSQRKSLLQQNPHFIPPRRSTSGPTSSAATPIYAHNPPAPTPYPHPGRPSPSPRHSTISAWRASLQASSSSTKTAHHRDNDQEIEMRRALLLAEKRRECDSRQEQSVSQTLNQSVRDRGMRHSGMMELHQRQMRKMQAEANKSLA